MEKYNQLLSQFYSKYKRMPGYIELMKLTGFKSKNAVFKLLNKLVDEGYIEKDSKGRISLRTAFNELPLLGLVEAGIPTVTEEIRDTMSLDEYLIKDRSSTYILEVKGDSMIEAGIQEGDLVIADRKGVPKDGDIVIAEIDGGWTMKYFKKKGNQVYLLPANKNYKPMYPEYQLNVAAIVRGVIRKLK